MAIDLSKYSLIFFDVDNTMIDTVGEMRRMIIETLEHAGDRATEEIIDGFFESNSRWWHRYHDGEITDLAELRLGRFVDLVRDFALTGDPAAMSEEYLELLRSSHRLFPGTRELIEELSKSHTLCVSSNSDEAQQRRRLALAGIDKYFTHWFVSDTHGYVKPDPQFFLEGMRRAGVTDKSKVLVVGDDPTADLPGARDAGLDCCFVSANAKAPAPDYVTYTVRYPCEMLGKTIEN